MRAPIKRKSVTAAVLVASMTLTGVTPATADPLFPPAEIVTADITDPSADSSEPELTEPDDQGDTDVIAPPRK